MYKRNETNFSILHLSEWNVYIHKHRFIYIYIFFLYIYIYLYTFIVY